MDPEVRKYLSDISDSIGIIELHLAAIPDLSSYKKDIKTADAVMRRLSIIGEALWKANKLDSALGITYKNKIIGLRHILIHDYDMVDDDAIWAICKKNLIELKKEVKALLETE